MKRILILTAALIAASYGAALYFAVTPDSHFVVLNRTGDTLWKSGDVVPADSLWIWADATDSLTAGFVRADSFIGPLIGNASSASLLQGKDTTALFNAKTLQGKDTTGLWIHAGTDSTGRSISDTFLSKKAGDELFRIWSDTNSNFFAGRSAGIANVHSTGDYGIRNTFIGSLSGLQNTSGGWNSGVGYNSLANLDTGRYNVAVGTFALMGYGGRMGGMKNTGVGTHTMYNNKRGHYNTAIGCNALLLDTSGSDNVAIGYGAGEGIRASRANVAVGEGALGAGPKQADGYAVAVGHRALNSDTSGRNVAIGGDVMYSHKYGQQNTAVGTAALQNDTSGANNTVVGEKAGFYSASGSNQTLIGRYAGYGAAAYGGANRNTSIGAFSGMNIGTSCTSNVYLGYRAGYNHVGSNMLYIANDSNTVPMILGNFATNLVNFKGSVNVAGTDSAQRQVGDTIRFTKGGGMTCVITGTNAWAGGLSDTASGVYAIVGGGIGNRVSSDTSAICGGIANKVTAAVSFIGGGARNSISGSYAAIGGGASNTITANNAVIGGGDHNVNYRTGGTVGGGYHNTMQGDYSTIAGGNQNAVYGTTASIGGGISNRIFGDYATISGGIANLDSAPYSSLHGDSLRAKATDSFSFGTGAGAGLGRLVSPGKRTVWWGVGGINQVAWGADSTVTQPGVDLVVHGPCKVDSAFTFFGVVVDSAQYSGDTLYWWKAGKRGVVAAFATP
ncbi:MAG TPA: hypothetical protein VM223_04530 [Planctomycetota bacterium]|nr:hypothetical protein [Planctomycetota bacterium]